LVGGFPIASERFRSCVFSHHLALEGADIRAQLQRTWFTRYVYGHLEMWITYASV
jgi:hypothetical protein